MGLREAQDLRRREMEDRVWAESRGLFCRRWDGGYVSAERAASWPQPGPLPSPPVPRVALGWWQWLSGGGLGSSDTLPSLGPSLRPLDLEFMKHLSKVVNIIPVIAKADTMTLEEKSEFKQRVRRLPPPFSAPTPPSPL